MTSASTGLPDGAAMQAPTSPLPEHGHATTGAPLPPGSQQGWAPGYAAPGGPQGWDTGSAPQGYGPPGYAPPGGPQGWQGGSAPQGYGPPGGPQGWAPGYAPPGAYATPGWQGGGPLPATPQDHEHLRALSIGYFIYAGLHAAGLVFAVIYLFLATAIMGTISAGARSAVPVVITTAIGGIMLVVLIVGAVFCYLYYLVGRSLTEHQRYPLILVMAGLTCLSFPLGTGLGVCTFIVLMRPTVKPLFGQA